MRTRLLFGLLILALSCAAVFAIWPVVRDAPWLDSENSVLPSPTPFPTARYSLDEAVGLVRAALDHEDQGVCPGKIRWAAEYSGGRSWLVAAACVAEFNYGPPIGLIPPGWNNRLWRLYEDDGRVIPLTDRAVEWMQPLGD